MDNGHGAHSFLLLVVFFHNMFLSLLLNVKRFYYFLDFKVADSNSFLLFPRVQIYCVVLYFLTFLTVKKLCNLLIL